MVLMFILLIFKGGVLKYKRLILKEAQLFCCFLHLENVVLLSSLIIYFMLVTVSWNHLSANFA